MMRLLRTGLFGLWVLTGSWAAWAADARLPSVTRATDLSASVSITVASVVSKPDRNARVNDYSAVATVLNTSRLWIPRPFMLVVTMANRSAVLANATGITAEGDPYIAVTGMLPLAGGRSMAIQIGRASCRERVSSPV